MKRLLSRSLCLLAAGALLTAACPAALAEDSSAAAPPSQLTLYIDVEGCSFPTLYETYTSSDLRILAMANTDKLYYTAMSNYGYNGRVVTEYVTVDQFFQDAGLTFSDGDMFIMGEDYTLTYPDYDYGSNEDNFAYWRNYGWYDYSDLYGQRYYFRNWSENDAVAMPAVLSMKSYGGNWTQESYWDMYSGSADYLWAYVVTFGQTSMMENTYNRFLYGQDTCTVKFAADGAANQAVTKLLTDCLSSSQTELTSTVVADSAGEVPEGLPWVTSAQYAALEKAIAAAQTADASTNGGAYSAYAALSKAAAAFQAAKRTGTKTGYAWFSPETYNATTNFTISTAAQMAEFAALVNGTADLGETMAQYDFSGKTVALSGDVDLEQYNITVGTADAPFRGTFDGAGHTLSNLRAVSDGAYVGLFGVNEGAIRNVNVTGSVTAAGENAVAGGIVGSNSGTVANCRSAVTVSAAVAGGIAGVNSSAVSDCLQTASVTGTAVAGGIVGRNNYAVIGSLSAGTVTGPVSGGIAGENADLVTACIHSGAAQYGLAGANTGSVMNSYSISAPQLAAGAGTVTDCYGSDEADLAAKAESIGVFTKVENGYPVLPWQAKYTVGFAVNGKTIPAQTVGEYLRAAVPADTERVNGWYQDSGYTTAFDFAAPVTRSLTVYGRLASSGGITGGGGGGSIGGGTAGGTTGTKPGTTTGETAAPCDGGETCPAHAYSDLTPAAWYHDGVHYCLEKGLMNGVGNGRFDPDGTVTRGQLVAILWRQAGSPAPGAADKSFSDVTDGAYYADAVRWAAAKGIVSGYDDGRFGPEDPVTREQLAALLYRYAQDNGMDVTQGGMAVREYSDYESISDYARPAMQWAVNAQIMKGTSSDTLSPAGTATRAQAASLMQRFLTVDAE